MPGHFSRSRKNLGVSAIIYGDSLTDRPSGMPVENHKLAPATTPLSDAISKDLKKRGFKFVGSTVVYAHMQATGMVNDHEISCFRYNEV